MKRLSPCGRAAQPRPVLGTALAAVSRTDRPAGTRGSRGQRLHPGSGLVWRQAAPSPSTSPSGQSEIMWDHMTPRSRPSPLRFCVCRFACHPKPARAGPWRSPWTVPRVDGPSQLRSGTLPRFSLSTTSTLLVYFVPIFPIFVLLVIPPKLSGSVG